MESAGAPSAEVHSSLGNGPTASGDLSQPANEPSAPTNTAITEDGGDKTLIEPQSKSETMLEAARNSPTNNSSGSIVSGTSTLKYSQEPFDQYRDRVEALCHSLWPAESRGTTPERREGGIAVSRILDLVRGRKVRRFLSPYPGKKFVIERLAGGTYNRIISIMVEDASNSHPKNLILRVPRPHMAQLGYIEREIAILRYVRQHTTLPVADVVSFDTTANNPLKSGYVVQSRLPGVSLHTFWGELTHEQRCTVAREVGKIVLALQSVKNPEPGIVEASLANDGSQKFRVCPFDIKSPYDVDWKTNISNHASHVGTETETLTPLEWFGTQFGRWLAHELLASPLDILYWDYQNRFVQAAKEMADFGFLGDGQNCLCHFDLAARNIMVQVLPNGSVEVSGIVDWDSAVFVPIFVSCAPPSWLWTNQDDYDTDEKEAEGTACTSEQEEIRDIFEEVVGFDWQWFAYRPGYRLARELFYFAQHGHHDGIATKRAEKFLEEWAAVRDLKTKPENGGENAEGSSGGDIPEDEVTDEATDEAR